MSDIEGLTIGQELERCTQEIARLRAENDRLRAALANSKGACVYCSLPAEEWAKCKSGFPGCSRADDAMGCPELGASLEASGLRARVAELEEALIAENDLITDCQTVLTRYLEGLPRGLTKDAAVSALLGLLDGPQQREAQDRAREALEGKP